MNETVTPETDASAEPEAEETSQQDDMDTLLAEWDQKEEKTPPKPPAPVKSPDEIKAEVMAELRAEQAYEKTVGEFLSDLSDMPFEVRRGVVEGFLNEAARKDSRINSAYTEQHVNPDAWQKVRARLVEDFKGQFKQKEASTVDQDREAAAAYVRGSSTQEVPQKELSNEDLAAMSDAEFNEYQRKKFKI